ncbi:MAG: hypothetical protein AAF503_03210, partial [Pseudomonadota bacterium]
MTAEDKQRQQMHAVNQSVNLAEALAARVKDPLWFLARQWQSGEFAAENGGRMAGVQMECREFPLCELTSGDRATPLDPAHPLDAALEAERQDHVAPNWRSEALEYQCTVKSSAHTFRIQDYDGHGLDWFHLELSETGNGPADEARVLELVPTQLEFRGEPHPRWWRLEDAESYFDSPQDSEFSVLSTLLPE